MSTENPEIGSRKVEVKKEKPSAVAKFANLSQDLGADLVKARTTGLSEEDWEKRFNSLRREDQRNDGVIANFIEQNKGNKNVLVKAAKYMPFLMTNGFTQYKPFAREVVMAAGESNPKEVIHLMSRFIKEPWLKEVAIFLAEKDPEEFVPYFQILPDQPWVKELAFKLAQNQRCIDTLLDNVRMGKFPWRYDLYKKLIDENINVDLKNIPKGGYKGIAYASREQLESALAGGASRAVAIHDAMMALMEDPTVDKKWFKENFKKQAEFLLAAAPDDYLRLVASTLKEPWAPEFILKAVKTAADLELRHSMHYAYEKPWGPKIYAQAVKIVEARKKKESKINSSSTK